MEDGAILNFGPDSAVKPNLPRAKRNPEAAKASDCEVAKLFCALARRCHEHSIPPNTVDRCQLRGRNPSSLLRKGFVSRFPSIATKESRVQSVASLNRRMASM